jgi:hypothetical protein
MNRLNSIRAVNKIYSYSIKRLSYETRVRQYDNSLYDRFRNNEQMNISELSNVARVMNNLKITDQLVLTSLQDAALPLLKNCDETDLRKLTALFVNNTLSEEFRLGLNNRYKHLYPCGDTEVITPSKLPWTMRFHIWLYDKRCHYLSLFRFLGINLK